MAEVNSAPVLCDLGADDYGAIVSLWERAGLHIRPDGRDAAGVFAAQMAGGQQHVIGLRHDGELVGVAVLTHDGRKGWINRLAVDPAWRRRGLAQRLISAAERYFADELGLEVWAALIEGWNAPSLALFERAGYARGDVIYVSKRTREDA